MNDPTIRDRHIEQMNLSINAPNASLVVHHYVRIVDVIFFPLDLRIASISIVWSGHDKVRQDLFVESSEREP